MSIPVIAGPVGYDSWYVKVFRNICEIVGDPKKFVLDWIAPEKKLVVHTDRLDDTTSYRITSMLEYTVPAGIKVERYNHTFEISWREINKYAECTDASELYAVAPDKHGSELHLGVTNYYTLDLTSDGNFIYPLPKLKKLAAGWGSSYFQKVTAEEFKISLPSLTGNNDRLFQTVLAKTIECDLPLVTQFSAGYCQYLRRFVGNTPNVTNWNYAFVACGWRHNEMLDIDCDFSKATTATDMASNSCKLNKASVLRICVGEKSIPAYTSGTHNITLGIHVDLQNDEEVLAAIASAETKGWTVTVQWNGTPTSTASVMRFGQLIYARVNETELPDGTTEKYIAWGHYVTNPDEYETFRSLESACEYFGLPNPYMQQ
jgi:hypothetical protein